MLDRMNNAMLIKSQKNDMSVDRLKVFGERNTGTNFLNKLLEVNFPSVDILEHRPNDYALSEFRSIKSAHWLYAVLNRRLLMEHLIDIQRAQEEIFNYGWKHACVEYDRIIKNASYSTTLFVFLVRNPWRFISSLHRNAYQLVPRPYQALERFIHQKFIPHHRDYLPIKRLVTPAELWNEKVESYFRLFSKKGLNMVLVRYEDVVTDPTAFVASLGQFVKPADELYIPHSSVKGGTRKTFLDYQKEVRLYSPMLQMGETIACEIERQLSSSLLASCRYTLK